MEILKILATGALGLSIFGVLLSIGLSIMYFLPYLAIAIGVLIAMFFMGLVLREFE